LTARPRGAVAAWGGESPDSRRRPERACRQDLSYAINREALPVVESDREKVEGILGDHLKLDLGITINVIAR
jgi:hypothetical protein